MAKVTTKATPATIAPKLAPKAKVAPAAPVVATPAPAAPVATTKAVPTGRYAPTHWEPTWVITGVKPNPKRSTGKSYTRYALHKEGQTVADYIAAVVEHGKANPTSGSNATIAGLDLRWGVQHGFFTIVKPKA
jgi:hypothetical protein